MRFANSMFRAARAREFGKSRAERTHIPVVEFVAGSQVVGDLLDELVGDALGAHGSSDQQADGDQPMAAATGALVSSNSAGSNRASRRLYSLANAGQIVKFRPSAPTYHE